MEEPEDKETNAVVNIAADGDVILVVGPEHVKLRVHSLFLKATSKPFFAMLGPNWKEGYDLLDQDAPLELLLPEDNATALELICFIIHHQNNEVPQTLSADDVLRVAITADKYDWVNTLKFANVNWLRPGGNKAGELMLLTAAAYLFQNAEAFNEVTKELILNHAGPYLGLLSEVVESAMPWRVFCLLEEQRSSARLKLAQILIAGINDWTGLCCHKCGWTSKYAYTYLKSLEEMKLWPARLLDVSISEAIEIAEKMPDPIPEEQSVQCKYGYKHAVPEYRKGRSSSLDDLNNDIGICLYCLRLGNINLYCTHCCYRA